MTSNTPQLAENYIGDELTLFAHADNWKAYWSSKIEPLLDGPVLEVGAGIGSNLALLRQRQQDWVALEPDASQAESIENSIQKSHAGIDVVVGTLDDVADGQLFKSVIYIDVLEHIEHDQEEVEKAFSHLQAGGRLIVLSPAHNRLFSPFDKAVGHFRRYNKTMLRALTPTSPEVKIESLYYLDSVGCLASFANMALLKQSMPTSKQIWLWDKLMVPISQVLDVLLGKQLGKTIVMVWQREP